MAFKSKNNMYAELIFFSFLALISELYTKYRNTFFSTKENLIDNNNKNSKAEMCRPKIPLSNRHKIVLFFSARKLKQSFKDVFRNKSAKISYCLERKVFFF